MRHAPTIDVIYTHTEGEPTCIVHSGISYPIGSDILEKREFLKERYDHVRTGLMREPRGHHHMFGVFVTPPSSTSADAGMIWMDGHRYVEMCGHGTIALGMAMVSQGLVPSSGDETKIVFETPVGDVKAVVESEGDEVLSTRFTNVPAFALEQDIPVEVPGVGELSADIVFGGNFFAIIKWPSDVRPIAPENGSFFAKMGLEIREQLRKRVQIRHPEREGLSELHFVTFWHEPTRSDSFYRNVHVFSDGKLDRSPGGTGTSAMMAMFHARGMLEIGQRIRSEGLLGSGQFEGWLDSDVSVGEIKGVSPNVKGTASLIGYAKWVFDPNDPLREGFVIS